MILFSFLVARSYAACSVDGASCTTLLKDENCGQVVQHCLRVRAANRLSNTAADQLYNTVNLPRKNTRLVVLVEPTVLPVSVSCGRCKNLGREKLLRADQEFGETGLTTVLKVLGCKASKVREVWLQSSAL